MNSDSDIKVALVQMHCAGSKEDNEARAVTLINKACENGSQIICLPELFQSSYFCQTEDPDNFDLAEPVPGPVTNKFSETAKKHNTVLIVPVFEKRARGIYHNSLAVINTGGELAGVYRKMHIPDDPGYYEKYYFTPGEDGFSAVKTSYGRIGALICWDQWFPEAARIVALGGANVIFYPTAIGWHPSEKKEYGIQQLDSWITVQRGHAIANGIYVAAVNRVGFEEHSDTDGIEFWGSSFVCGPQGEIISKASDNKEEIIYAVIKPELIENVRRNWPFLRDRRLEYYKGICERVID